MAGAVQASRFPWVGAVRASRFRRVGAVRAGSSQGEGCGRRVEAGARADLFQPVGHRACQKVFERVFTGGLG
ncbi:hypothetical protein [Enorma phocaeensis]|uniref:hypothetical protein n=1 Tax=Enorma phocaeensis TaxID=1871019 RepID=UPI00195CD842|nr:hypothetical protein [Enorma phocaeensis]MBM6953424.1 hypothetical protein [Enorma phocaeensis]